MIEVTDLVKKYGTHLAVDHLSFRVEPGKIYGFLGPNGAGKSTTMNIITGYIAASAGQVRVDGHDIVKDTQEARKRIGYLPEIPPLYPDMTVREYLRFVAQLKKIPGAVHKKQIGEVMELTGLEDVSGRLIRNLSKGYRQRTGLAQAVLGYPPVIILDEPTVGLDPRQIIEIRELMRKLGEEHTVLLSSHILSEVQAVCDEILILSRGRLAASGTARSLTGQINKSVGIKLEILGTREQVEPLIMGLDRVLGYRFTTSCPENPGREAGGNERPGNSVRVILETDAGDDIREELFYLLAREHLPILSMNRVEKSLEDIFLQLTGGDGAAAQAQVLTGKGEEGGAEDAGNL